LRYDLTVPLARFYGANPNLRLPFKRYEIGKVFRDGPVKVGRFREFTQCDFDVVGLNSMLAEFEIINIFLTGFNELNLKIKVIVNNRKLLDGLLVEAGIQENDFEKTILSIDKKEKLGWTYVEKELIEKGLLKKEIEKIKELIEISGDNKIKLANVKQVLSADNKIGLQGWKELNELIDLLGNKIEIDFSLSRGLSYYTGTVFECFLSDGSIKSSIGAGGRYNKMLASFLNKEEEIPAVGASFGLEVIFEAMKSQVEKQSLVQVYLIPIGIEVEKVLPIVQKLRNLNVNCDFDFFGKGISKNLDYCNKQGILFAGIIGENELKENNLTLKDLTSGEQTKIKLNDLEKIKVLIEKEK